jgi:hypothetical protein
VLALFHALTGVISRFCIFVLAIFFANILTDEEFAGYIISLGWANASSGVAMYSVSALFKSISVKGLLSRRVEYFGYLVTILYSFVLMAFVKVFIYPDLIFVYFLLSTVLALYGVQVVTCGYSNRLKEYNVVLLTSSSVVIFLSLLINLSDFSYIIYVWLYFFVYFITVTIICAIPKFYSMSLLNCDKSIEGILFDINNIKLFLHSSLISLLSVPLLALLQTYLGAEDPGALAMVYFATQILNLVNLVCVRYLQVKVKDISHSIRTGTPLRPFLIKYVGLLLSLILFMVLTVCNIKFISPILKVTLDYEVPLFDRFFIVTFLLMSTLTSIAWFYNEVVILKGKSHLLLLSNVVWAFTALLVYFAMSYIGISLGYAYAFAVFGSRIFSNYILFKGRL